MRKRILVFAVSSIAALALAGPASADHTGCPAANDPSTPGHSEFAHHHIVPLAQAGALGAGGHVPGSHHGMSGCHPEANRP